MSWQWESCKDGACITIVYADSLSPVSADEYRFTDHPDYVAMFRGGIARLAGLECDMLLTPHPSASGMISRAAEGSFESGISCRDYASAADGSGWTGDWPRKPPPGDQLETHRLCAEARDPCRTAGA